MKSYLNEKMKKKQTSKPHNIHWKETLIPEQKITKCEHNFEFIGTECKCQKCNTGLIGVYKVENGKPVV